MHTYNMIHIQRQNSEPFNLINNSLGTAKHHQKHIQHIEEENSFKHIDHPENHPVSPFTWLHFSHIATISGSIQYFEARFEMTVDRNAHAKGRRERCIGAGVMFTQVRGP